MVRCRKTLEVYMLSDLGVRAAGVGDYFFWWRMATREVQ